MKTYTIAAGSFRLADGSLRHAGETIDLEDDVAALHVGNLVPVAQDAAPPPAAEGVAEGAAEGAGA